MIIKKLKREINELMNEVNEDVMPKEEREKKEAQLKVFEELWKFVESGDWIGKKGKKKLQVYIAHGSDGLEKEFNLNKKQVGRTVYYMNSTLERYIDESMIEKVKRGDGGKVLKQLKGRVVRIEDELMEDVKRVIGGDSGINIKHLNECELELKFLRDYSLNMMYKRLSELDMDKVNSIVNVLKSDEKKYSKQKGILVQYIIDGKGDEKKVVEIMKKIFNCEV